MTTQTMKIGKFIVILQQTWHQMKLVDLKYHSKMDIKVCSGLFSSISTHHQSTHKTEKDSHLNYTLFILTLSLEHQLQW